MSYLYNTSLNICTVRRLTVEKLTVIDFSYAGDYKKTNRADFLSCTGIDCTFSNLQLYETRLLGCVGRDISTNVVKLIYSNIVNGDFRGCQLNANIVNCNIVDTIFDECLFDYIQDRGRMRLEECNIENCTFSNVDFGEVKVIRTTFKDCRFYNCTFSAPFAKYAVMEGCEMDEASRSNFDDR